jgi:hypothetical protein
MFAALYAQCRRASMGPDLHRDDGEFGFPDLAANVIPAQAGTQDTSIETGHVEPVHDALRLAVERGIALEHERVVAGHDTRR